jgi:probable addiction module antidote protein
LEIGDPAFFARALGVASRAKGMTRIAKDAGLSREALYRALSEDGDPRLSTLFGVMKARGVRLAATAGALTEIAASPAPQVRLFFRIFRIRANLPFPVEQLCEPRHERLGLFY